MAQYFKDNQQAEQRRNGLVAPVNQGVTVARSVEK
jgi:hypothetical protein